MKINTTTDGLDVGETVKAFSNGQKLLNRYKLDRVLGQGGMGVVWLARDEELERDIAMKFLPAIFVNDRASLLELKRETRRSLELTHPNIVRTYDFVQDNAIAGISMEYVENDTLRNRRLDQPGGVFATEQIAPWVQQLCSALDYAHIQAAIVHRDLKPANLMLNGRDQLKIADFGISRSLVESMSTLTARHGVSGTLVYMSPQQLTGEPSTAADDIYALGATLYELLTTRPPFFSGDIAGQVHGKVPPSLAERRQSFGVSGSEIPQNWEKTIAECLAKDPAQRPRSAGRVAVGLGLATAAEITLRTNDKLPPLAAKPTAAPSEFASAPSSRWRTAVSSFTTLPASRRRVAIGALAAVLLAGLAGVLATKSSRENAEAGRQREASALVLRKQQERDASEESGRREAARLAALRGSIVVKATPAFAKVQVGDGPLEDAPAAISDLKLGEYAVQISAEGYEPRKLSVEVKEKELVKDLGMVALVRSTGGLKITSVPPELECVIRGKTSNSDDLNGKTPLDFLARPTGDYEVTVKRPGWPPETRPLTVTRGQVKEELFRFEGGGVMLTSTPPKAKVRRGSEDLGVTPLPLEDQPAGETQYTFSLAGYEDATVKATIVPGETVPVAPTLKKIARAAPAPRVAQGSISGAKRGHSGGPSANRGSGSSGGSRSSNSSRPDPDSRGERLKRAFLPGYDLWRK